MGVYGSISIMCIYLFLAPSHSYVQSGEKDYDDLGYQEEQAIVKARQEKEPNAKKVVYKDECLDESEDYQ